MLTHGDLNEMNILAGPESGEITGVVDWAEASFQPFGFELYALDSCLGSMGPEGWKFLDDADYLRAEFWSTFDELVGGLSEETLETIRLARAAGLLVRYGTPYNSGLTGMVRDGGSGDDSPQARLVGGSVECQVFVVPCVFSSISFLIAYSRFLGSRKCGVSDVGRSPLEAWVFNGIARLPEKSDTR